MDPCSYIKIIVLLLVSVAFVNTCTIIKRGLSPKNEQNIIKAHSYYRDLIRQGKVPGQPKGTNLKKIKYDKTLAILATVVSSQCKFEHLDVYDSRFDDVGQNLYKYCSNKGNEAINFTMPIAEWFDEYKNFEYPDKKIDSNQYTEHYTQIVWGETKFIGCDYIMYKDDEEEDIYCHLYTCHYGPSGNYENEAPYVKA